MNRMTNEDIFLTGITKIFRLGLIKKKTAVEDITFGVSPGEVVGLLGPNGSGKSTIIKLILGFLKPTRGEILIGGMPNSGRHSRAMIGYLPENPRFQKFLTGDQVMRYYGSLLGLRGKALAARTEYLLELVNLKPAGRERIQGYSKGMTQRLAIAQSLLNHPRLLIFDEPMSGLDPLGRLEIRKLISDIHRELPNSTLFFSTHILSDVEQLCSSVVVLRKGTLIRQCSLRELIGTGEQRYDITVGTLPPSTETELRKQKTLVESPIGLTFNAQGPDELLHYLEKLKTEGVKVVGISSHRKSLEETLFSDLNPQTQRPESAGVSL
jgi:ABC-2 type transport system ATP-binding protein